MLQLLKNMLLGHKGISMTANATAIKYNLGIAQTSVYGPSHEPAV